MTTCMLVRPTSWSVNAMTPIDAVGRIGNMMLVDSTILIRTIPYVNLEKCDDHLLGVFPEHPNGVL